MTEHSAATFTGLVDLAAEALGGRALGANDDFFAGVENLIKPGRGVFIPGKFTERGKWMDGWESRRRREPGHDWCVLALGVPGRVVGFDIDTHHFVGNHPAFACVEGALAPPNSSFESLTAASNAAGSPAGDTVTWHELLPQVPLRPSSQNLFAALPGAPAVSHVRLNIFPDGGVARFRVFGNVEPLWLPPELDSQTRTHVTDQVDLVALSNGGMALACSDAHFGPMNNLLLPGRAEDMGGGWETRRNRGPGHDWVLLRLAARGTPEVIEIDTNHFKGNYPDRCSLQVIDAGASRITDLIASSAWTTVLPESKLQPHTRHFFNVPPTAATHLRINIFPDGGISRVRAWGHRL